MGKCVKLRSSVAVSLFLWQAEKGIEGRKRKKNERKGGMNDGIGMGKEIRMKVKIKIENK